MQLRQRLLAQEVHHLIDRVRSHLVESAIRLGLADLLEESLCVHDGPGELELLDRVLEDGLTQGAVTGTSGLFKRLSNSTTADKACFL